MMNETKAERIESGKVIGESIHLLILLLSSQHYAFYPPSITTPTFADEVRPERPLLAVHDPLLPFLGLDECTALGRQDVLSVDARTNKDLPKYDELYIPHTPHLGVHLEAFNRGSLGLGGCMRGQVWTWCEAVWIFD
jgi:hypothetical protein